jgi:hypothetical protein
MPAADLIATVTGVYYSTKQGARFTLASAVDPENTVSVNVYYSVGGLTSRLVDRPQYINRLAVEVIHAVNQLQP